MYRPGFEPLGSMIDFKYPDPVRFNHTVQSISQAQRDSCENLPIARVYQRKMDIWLLRLLAIA